MSLLVHIHAATGPRCFACRSPDVTGACSRCHVATYCSAECATRGVREFQHELTCAQYADLMDEPSPSNFDGTESGTSSDRGRRAKRQRRTAAVMQEVIDVLNTETIPAELAMAIVNFLPHATIRALARTNKYHHAVVYKALFLRDFALAKDASAAESAFVVNVLRDADNDYYKAYTATVGALAAAITDNLLARLTDDDVNEDRFCFFIRDCAANQLLFRGIITRPAISLWGCIKDYYDLPMGQYKTTASPGMFGKFRPKKEVLELLAKEPLPVRYAHVSHFEFDMPASMYNEYFAPFYYQPTFTMEYTGAMGASDVLSLDRPIRYRDEETTLESELLRHGFGYGGSAHPPTEARLRECMWTFLSEIIQSGYSRLELGDIVFLPLDELRDSDSENDDWPVCYWHSQPGALEIERVSLATGNVRVRELQCPDDLALDEMTSPCLALMDRMASLRDPTR